MEARTIATDNDIHGNGLDTKIRTRTRRRNLIGLSTSRESGWCINLQVNYTLLQPAHQICWNIDTYRSIGLFSAVIFSICKLYRSLHIGKILNTFMPVLDTITSRQFDDEQELLFLCWFIYDINANAFLNISSSKIKTEFRMWWRIFHFIMKNNFNRYYYYLNSIQDVIMSIMIIAHKSRIGQRHSP